MTKVFNFALKIKGGGREGGTCEVLRPCHPPKIWNVHQARLDVTGFLLRPYDVVVLLYQAKLFHEIGLSTGLSFCLGFNFGIDTFQPETGYHNSDSRLFKIP